MKLKKSCRTCRFCDITEECVEDYDGAYSQYWTCGYMKASDVNDECSLYEPIDVDDVVDFTDFQQQIQSLHDVLVEFDKRIQIFTQEEE